MNYYSVQKSCEMAKVSKTLMKKLICEEKIVLYDGKLAEDVIMRIMNENKKYISLREYALQHNNDQFHGKIARNRNNLLDVLEKHEFYGLVIYEPEELF